MKTYTKSAIILLAALSLAGCSKTEEFQNNPDSALEIASVSGISSYKLMSKAVITDDSLPNNESAKGIGLFVTATDGGAYDGKTEGFSNVRYTYNGEKWSTTTPVYLSKTEGKLYGYFPYSEAATNLKAIPVASSLNGTDYLYATTNDVSYTDKSVSLQMNHALARFHLTIKKGDKYLKDCNLSKILIESKAIDSYGTMDITMGTVAGSKTEGETGCVVFDGDGVTGTVTETGIEKDILLVPADNENGKKELFLTLTIDGSDAKIKFSGEGGLDIRSGIQCNATIEIQDSGIKVIGVGVATWGEGGSQEVQVNGHKVTVKLAEEQKPDLANDIIYTPTITNDGKVILEAISRSQKRLECYLEGKASCAKGTTTLVYYQPIGNYDPIIFISHVFTISDISSDIIATIGYPRPESINLSLSSFTTYVGCSSFKLTATVLPDDAVNKNLTWSSSNPSVATVDENGRVSPNVVGTANITATTEVGGITATCTVTVKPAEELILSGEFSVGPADNCKKVRFSRGNLRYTSNPESWCFFDNQYEQGHSQDQVSLFTWGYGSWSTGWKTTSYESGNFTDWGTKIGNGSTWRTLKSDEWAYLLEGRTDAANKVGYATVCEMHGLLLLPDEFEDPKTNESTSQACVEKKFVPKSSTGWEQNIYSQGDSWNKMQAAGAVFFPAAGYRDGDPGNPNPAAVYNVGNGGYYWSASPYYDSDAYDLYFHSGYVNPSFTNIRDQAYSVRLVTESK